MAELKNNFRDRLAIEHVKTKELRCRSEASQSYKEGFDLGCLWIVEELSRILDSKDPKDGFADLLLRCK